MKQSRLMSLVEAIANVLVGYGVAVLTQLVIFPWFGLPARVGDALAIRPRCAPSENRLRMRPVSRPGQNSARPRQLH